MQPGAPPFLPGGFDPNDPKLNLLAQRMKSHLRKPFVNTGFRDLGQATYVPVLDRGVPDERFGDILGRRKYAGSADAWAADVGSVV